MTDRILDLSTIRKFPRTNYVVDIEIDGLSRSLDYYKQDYGLDLDPDFQRGHVWTESQQTAFVEWILRGGESGRTLLWNCHGFTKGMPRSPFTIVDGKQRLTALQRFLNDELPVFGARISQIERRKFNAFGTIKFQVFDLDRPSMLQLYLDFNSGGTPHDPSEISRVQELLAKEQLRLDH